MAPTPKFTNPLAQPIQPASPSSPPPAAPVSPVNKPPVTASASAPAPAASSVQGPNNLSGKSIAVPPPVAPPPPLTEKVVLNNEQNKEEITGRVVTEEEQPIKKFSVPTDEEIAQERARSRAATKGWVSPDQAVVPPAPTPVPPKAEPLVSKPAISEQLKPIGPQPPVTKMETPAPAAPLPPPPPSPVPTPPAVANVPPSPMKGDIALGEPVKRPKWLVPVVLFSVFGLLGVIALILQSNGVFYSKLLARLVGGIPRNTTQAITVMRDAVLNAGAYEYEAVTTIVLDDDLPNISSEDAPAALAEATINHKGQVDIGAAASNFEAEIASSYLPAYSYLKGQYVKKDSSVNVFLDLILVGNNPWREIRSATFEESAVSIPFASLELSNLLDKTGSEDGQLLGRSTVPASTGSSEVNGGAPVLVYEYPLNNLVDSQDAKIEQARLTLWVSKKTGKILLYQTDALLNAEVTKVVISTQVRPTSFGGVTVAGVPEGAAVEPGAIKDYFPLLGLTEAATEQPVEQPIEQPVEPPTEQPTPVPTPTSPITEDLTTPAGRDKRRLADLNSIKTALIQYKSAKGSYPVSTSVDKTNASTVLKSALVSGYLSSLPVDPNNSQYWYGYTSDGFSFTLTSVIEDSASTGKQGANVRYQEITN